MNSTQVPEVWIELQLLGEFDPHQVTELLGITPTSQHTKGTPMGSGRSGRLWHQSSWLVTSEHEVNADTVEPHLTWLLDLIEPKAASLAALREAGAECRTGCSWASIGTGGGPWLMPESMGRLAALNLPLVISFHATEWTGA